MTGVNWVALTVLIVLFALVASFVATLTALLVFGYSKGRFTGTRPVRSALQTTLIGGLAAGAAYLIAMAFS